MPIPLTVLVLKIGDKHIMIDAGSGVGQWQANATHLPANMRAAGIDRAQISTILVSHFHPDHVWGLMEKGTNAAVFPEAELVVNRAEYDFWTEPGRVEKLPEGRRAADSASPMSFPRGRIGGLSKVALRSCPAFRSSRRMAIRPAIPSSW